MNKNYYTIEIQSIKQCDAEVHFGSINFRDLQKSSKLSARVDDSKEFQRKPNPNSYKKIKEFIEKRVKNKNRNNLPIFPTPLILGIDIEYDIFVEHTKNEIDRYFNTYDIDAKALFFKEEKKLYIPKKGVDNRNNVVLIVDGQHRFLGVNEYILESVNVKDFTFLATFMIGSDIYQQSVVFADVNFNQKPVNKSLMYDILSVVPGDKNEAIFSHFIVKEINESEELKNTIKMLGTGSGIVSAAFMLETIQNKMIKKGNLAKYYKQYFLEEGKDFINIPYIFIDYFSFIKNNFNEYFPKPKEDNTFSVYNYKSILFKTTGIYAWIMLLNDIFQDINVKTYDKNIFYKQLDIYMKKIIAEQDTLFGLDSKFGGAGSASLQKKLYEKFKELTPEKFN